MSVVFALKGLIMEEKEYRSNADSWRRLQMNTRITSRYYLSVIVLFLFSLYGCGSNFGIEPTPLPPEKLNYEGHWEATGTTLIITRDGTLSYKKVTGSRKTSVNGPIKNFENDNIVVGVWIFTTTFEVQEPPHQENGQWVMVVDGAKLYKKAFKQEPEKTPPPPAIGA